MQHFDPRLGEYGWKGIDGFGCRSFGPQDSPLRQQSILKMGAGLSAQRIYQDLVQEKGLLGPYQSVKRFVRRLRQRQPERVWRIECQPGEEMQVDFGLGAPIEQDNGKMRAAGCCGPC